MIKDSDKAYLLSLKPKDLTFSTLVGIFGDTVTCGDNIKSERKSRFETTDEMILYPNEYFVKEETKTTVGRFIYNKYIIERVGLQDITGYINFPITNSTNGKIEKMITNALIADKVSISQFVEYIDTRDNLGLQLNSVITTSFTPKTISAPKEIQTKKKELFKKYDKELENGDIVTSEKIEKELTNDVRKLLKGDPGMDLYNSEARGNFGNYKNMNIFKGATMNPNTGKYEIVRSSFMDGIQKQDIPAFGNAVISGSYPKAVATQDSGYLSKQIVACMQCESLDEHGTDCHTTKTLEILITNSNHTDYEYRYIVDNGGLVCLTPDVLKKYIGKTVKLRSPMYCTGDKICNICAGEFDYKLNNINVGLGCSNISTKLLRMGMKKFHTSNIESTVIDVNDMLL